MLSLATVCIFGCQSDDSVSNAEMPLLAPIGETEELTEESLRAIDQKYSCRLPDDYRRFLLQNNGGFPSTDCITFVEFGRKTASDVFCFFAFDDERPWASMDWHYETYSGRLPPETLPIGRDSCGNLWLLGVGGRGAGSVYFWDHGSYGTFDETDIKNWPRVAGYCARATDSDDRDAL